MKFGGRASRQAIFHARTLRNNIFSLSSILGETSAATQNSVRSPIANILPQRGFLSHLNVHFIGILCAFCAVFMGGRGICEKWQ